MCKVIGYDSFSELPGFLLGTSWTVRSAMLMYKEGGKSTRSANSCWDQVLARNNGTAGC